MHDIAAQPGKPQDTLLGRAATSSAVIDFETRSFCDLGKHGAWRYSKHVSTEVLCMAYQLPGQKTKLWMRGDPFPHDLGLFIAHGGLVEAHNYFFEKCIWEHIMSPQFNWPWIPDQNWRCTAALASRHNLPRSLEGACKAAGLPAQKDKEGHSLMLKMCKPRRATKSNNSVWHESAEDLRRLGEYCVRDVDATRALINALEPLNDRELALWQFTEELNWRGVRVDLEFAEKAIEIFEAEKHDAEKRISELTNGAVTTGGQTARIADFCVEHGVKLDNLQKPTVVEALAGDLPDVVRELLTLRLSLSKGASISKFTAILNRADLEDWRLRDHVRYFGAGPGRWAGKGVQTQNLVRDMDLKKAARFKHLAKTIKPAKAMRLLFPDVTKELSPCVRPTFQAAPGKSFVCADYSAIEARVMAWLVGDPNLELFRQNKDIYIEMASAIYGREITKQDKTERALGKEAELACQYQLWWKTLLTRCWQKGVKIDPELAIRTVGLYRTRHPLIIAFWEEINRAFVECILYGKETAAGPVSFRKDKKNLHMVFPSGRYIVYNNVSVKLKKPATQKAKDLAQKLQQLGAPAAVIHSACELHKKETEGASIKARQVGCYWRESTTSYKWIEVSTYGGKIAGNACQGIAGDVLSHASLRLDQDPERFGVAVMTEHDELVMEQYENKCDLDAMVAEMCLPISWAPGLPLAAEGWVGRDFRKE